MTEKSYWLTSGLYALFQRFAVLVFNFGSFYFIVRMFTKEENGVWALFMTIATNFIELTRAGLIQNALVRYLSVSHPDDHPALLTASALLNVAFTAFIAVLLWLSSSLVGKLLHAPDLSILLLFYIPTSLILTPFFQFQAIQQAYLDFKGIFWANFTRQGLFFGGILSALLLRNKPSLLQLVNLQTLSALAGTTVAFVSARPFLKFSRQVNKKWLSTLFDYGRYGMITNLSTSILGSIDSFMLSGMIGAKAVAVQNVALRITNLAEVPVNAMADVVFPQSARRISTQGRESVKYLYEKAVGVLLALVVPAMVCIGLFPEFILGLIAGEKFLDAAPVLRVTALYTMLMPFGRQGGTLLDATGKQQLNSRLVVLSALINLAANFLFIRQFGIIGASYGTLFTYVVGTFIQQYFLRKEAAVSTVNVLGFAFRFYGEMWGMLKKRLLKK